MTSSLVWKHLSSRLTFDVVSVIKRSSNVHGLMTATEYAGYLINALPTSVGNNSTVGSFTFKIIKLNDL